MANRRRRRASKANRPTHEHLCFSVKLSPRIAEAFPGQELDRVLVQMIEWAKPELATAVNCQGSGFVERAYARGSGSSTCCAEAAPAWLGGLADQHVVGSWGGAGADAEEGVECGMPRPASIEAEHKLIQVVLEVRPPQSMVDAEAPALEV